MDNEFLTDRNEIEAWLEKMCVKNYTIRNDGVVDVNGNVVVTFEKLTRLPIQFGIVTGDFDCSLNDLTSLAGCPAHVGGHLFFFANNITSLEKLPTTIGGTCNCRANKITSHALGLILTGCINLRSDEAWVKIINKYIRRPDDIFECQAELIDNGFEAYAQL